MYHVSRIAQDRFGLSAVETGARLAVLNLATTTCARLAIHRYL